MKYQVLSTFSKKKKTYKKNTSFLGEMSVHSLFPPLSLMSRNACKCKKCKNCQILKASSKTADIVKIAKTAISCKFFSNKNVNSTPEKRENTY